MKNFIWIAVLFVAASCQQKSGGKTFTVEGVIKGTEAATVYLEENTPAGRPTTIDSTTLKADGSFTLKTRAKEEGLYQLRLQGKMVPFAFVINDADKVRINADLTNTTTPYTVQQSPATEAMLQFDRTMYEKGMQLFTEGGKVDSLRSIQAPDSVVAATYQRVEEIAGSLKEYTREVIAKSNSPMLTLYALGSYQNTASNLGIRGLSRTEVAEIVNLTSERFPQHSGVASVRKGLPSNKATDFTQPDVNGQPVSLSQFRGKYVLVDFWASWCQPCRQENPNVVKAYNEFKDKNFTILGVSLDQNKDAWVKAIQQDGLTWTHVSDLKFWENAAATSYGVQSIPYNVLVDPEGNIVAESLHGEDMIQTLRKVVK